MSGSINLSGPPTVRAQIVSALEARFLAAPNNLAGVAIPNTTISWSAVVRREVTQSEIKAGATVALFDRKEKVTREFMFDKRHLELIIEFYCNMLIGDEPSVLLNAMLANVQAVVLYDTTCGGLSLDIQEVGSELASDGPLERIVAGMVTYDVIYRTRMNDPFNQ